MLPSIVNFVIKFSRSLRFMTTKNTQHFVSIKTTNIDSDHSVEEADDRNFEEEMCSCQRFLVDSELQRETQCNQFFDRKPQRNKS